MAQVKRIFADTREELEKQNKARRLIKVHQLKIKVRTCFRCACEFESINNYFCADCTVERRADESERV